MLTPEEREMWWNRLQATNDPSEREALIEEFEDHFTELELLQARIAEELTATALRQREVWGNEQCVAVAKEVAGAVDRLMRELFPAQCTDA